MSKLLHNPLAILLILVSVGVASYFYFSAVQLNSFTFSRPLPPIKHKGIKKHVFGDYEVWEIFGILTPEECKKLQEIAIKKGMTPSEIISYGSSTDRETDNTMRKSVQAWLPDETDPLIMKLANYTESITQLPRKNQEMIQIVKYDPGGQFISHYDTCDHEDQDYCARVNHFAGHRRATLLIYLNEDFDGGETEFPNLGLTIKPQTGKGILFWTTKDDDKIIKESLHRGHKVEKGNKWIATKWTHPNEWREFD
jgi:prolyl 4-hydroxylase